MKKNNDTRLFYLLIATPIVVLNLLYTTPIYANQQHAIVNDMVELEEDQYLDLAKINKDYLVDEYVTKNKASVFMDLDADVDSTATLSLQTDMENAEDQGYISVDIDKENSNPRILELHNIPDLDIG